MANMRGCTGRQSAPPLERQSHQTQAVQAGGGCSVPRHAASHLTFLYGALEWKLTHREDFRRGEYFRGQRRESDMKEKQTGKCSVGVCVKERRKVNKIGGKGLVYGNT